LIVLERHRRGAVITQRSVEGLCCSAPYTPSMDCSIAGTRGACGDPLVLDLLPRAVRVEGAYRYERQPARHAQARVSAPTWNIGNELRNLSWTR
jgi:hypothetical protein